MKDLVGYLILFAINVVVILGVISWYTDLPIVQISYSTGQCVRVWTPPGESQYTCNNLPSRYIMEHVK